ncbi:DUF1365 domain-containing protein [Kordiimonas aestuarii]|uniref:DUF1365 domain-containing protein n=1 Tax=Kordiimonas aestuarii TaxID=1005925 RepID=UPI0021D32E90|nr:DUF1365 domain-containing protein [Kordiimonas aestuarii]
MTAGMVPSIYEGQVWHKRYHPRVHAFRYPVFYLLLDLDAFDGKVSAPGVALDRLGLFSLWQRDFGARTKTGLKDHICNLVTDAGAQTRPTKVSLLTMPRILGYGFNPITLFYCYGADTNLLGVVYEVHNTFGETHSYVHLMNSSRLLPHSAPKELHVSPFFDVSGNYEFRLRPPGRTFALLISYFGKDGTKSLTASLTAKQFPLNTPRLLGLFLRMPFVTVKVIAAIHYEALKLWLKGMPFHRKPTPPQHKFCRTSLRTGPKT